MLSIIYSRNVTFVVTVRGIGTDIFFSGRGAEVDMQIIMTAFLGVPGVLPRKIVKYRASEIQFAAS